MFTSLSAAIGLCLIDISGLALSKSDAGETVIHVFMLILGVVTSGIGFWAWIMTCITPIGPCCDDTPEVSFFRYL